MKKILAIFMAAAALTALASCQKEKLENTDNEHAQTVRIISGAFNNDGTKTTLDTDNVTPLWSVGDKIRVLDGTSYQDVTLVANGSTPGANEGVISADGKSFSFATTLTGTQLYAVYPASATTMTSCTDGNITFTVPAIQDGTFASANICVASGDGSTANTIYFSNATAIVEMTVASGVVYANLTATNKIAGDMTVAMGSNGTINSTTTTSLSSNYIFVSDTPTGSIFYLAVAPVETGAVTITCNTTSKTGSTNKTTKTLAMDKIYTMNLSGMTIDTEDLTGQHGVLNGQEYVLIKGSDGKYLKWATQNLAVTASGKVKWKNTNYQIGDYFQWAASYDGYNITTANQIPTNLVIYESFTTTFTGGISNTFSFKSGKDAGFVIENAPYYSGSAYTNYTSAPATLAVTDDVANMVLGSTWRMPTGDSTGEFQAMRDVTYLAWDENDLGCYVFKPGFGTSGTAGGNGTYGINDDKTKSLLFFPAAGGCQRNIDIDFIYVGERVYYWSSTLFTMSTEWAYDLYSDSEYFIPNDAFERFSGFSVRPVSN